MKISKLICMGIFGCLVNLITACGSGSHDGKTQSYAQRPIPIIFGFAGNNSCNSDAGELGFDGIYGQILDLQRRLVEEGHAEVEYFVTCYTNGANKISYLNSWEQRPKLLQEESVVREKVFEKLRSLHHAKSLMVGHSYGGWLAMSLAKSLSAEEELGYFYTLDPISKKNCNFSDLDGCNEAPRDILPEMREHIAVSTDEWNNYYQDNTWFLHSSAISHASSNVKLADADHFDIDEHGAIWQDIYEKTQSF
ncbi:MAG: hypothetical protein R3B45_13770 [Bdellovibrionota bacterium]